MGETILGTLMKMKDKTKDSVNARLEAKQLRTGVPTVSDDEAEVKRTPVSYVFSSKEGTNA